MHALEVHLTPSPRRLRMTLSARGGLLDGTFFARLHAGYSFAASLLFIFVRASSRPFKVCPKPGFVHFREPERTLLNGADQV